MYAQRDMSSPNSMQSSRIRGIARHDTRRPSDDLREMARALDINTVFGYLTQRTGPLSLPYPKLQDKHMVLNQRPIPYNNSFCLGTNSTQVLDLFNGSCFRLALGWYNGCGCVMPWSPPLCCCPKGESLTCKD